MLTTMPFPLWVKKRKVVNSSDSLVADELIKAQFTTLRYKLSVYSLVENKFYTSDVLISKTPSGLVSVVSNKVNKSNLKFLVNDTEDATSFFLSIVNNEAFGLNVDFARLTLKQ